MGDVPLLLGPDPRDVMTSIFRNTRVPVSEFLRRTYLVNRAIFRSQLVVNGTICHSSEYLLKTLRTVQEKTIHRLPKSRAAMLRASRLRLRLRHPTSSQAWLLGRFKDMVLDGDTTIGAVNSGIRGLACCFLNGIRPVAG